MAEENASPENASPGAPASAEAASPPGAAPGDSLDLVMDVPVRVTVEVGSARLRVREVLQFNQGSVIERDRASGEPADLLVNGNTPDEFARVDSAERGRSTPERPLPTACSG